jgi:hypothetical protein
VSKLYANGWKNFVARDKDSVKELRTQIQTLASETGLGVGEFRKIGTWCKRRALGAPSKEGDDGEATSA